MINVSYATRCCNSCPEAKVADLEREAAASCVPMVPNSFVSDVRGRASTLADARHGYKLLNPTTRGVLEIPTNCGALLLRVWCCALLCGSYKTHAGSISFAIAPAIKMPRTRRRRRRRVRIRRAQRRRRRSRRKSNHDKHNCTTCKARS